MNVIDPRTVPVTPERARQLVRTMHDATGKLNVRCVWASTAHDLDVLIDCVALAIRESLPLVVIGDAATLDPRIGGLGRVAFDGALARLAAPFGYVVDVTGQIITFRWAPRTARKRFPQYDHPANGGSDDE